MKFLRIINSIWLCVSLTVIASPVGLGSKRPIQEIRPFVTTCAADGEASTKERETVDQLALQFVQNALGPDPSTAYAAFTSDAREKVPSQQFVAAFQNAIKPMGPFKDLRAEHTYIAKVTGGNQEQRVVCGNIAKPEGWVAVSVKPGPAEAYVIVEGETVNNTVVFVVWLIPEQGKWHVQYVQYAVAKMVGKSAEDLRNMAEVENQKRHDFNAFVLYTAALQLADRGPFLQLGIRTELEKKIGQIERPTKLQGQLPFVWNFGKSTFTVLNVGPMGIGRNIYLLLDHEIEPWTEDKEAEAKNRNLIAAFAQSNPEYKEAFAGLIVRAHERGGTRGFGTVEENQKQSK